jgi:hypothetical protein
MGRVLSQGRVKLAGNGHFLLSYRQIMRDEADEIADPDDEQEIALEPLPAFAEEQGYLTSVAQLPTPTREQTTDFVQYVAGAKSWYKHIPARPPGTPMFFYLDPNAGRDRLRRWGHEVIYRDRTEHTEQFHYSWITTQEYRQRFGYLAFCCPNVTSLFMTEMLDDGIATLDPNVSAPLIEGAAGRLSLVPEVVLDAGACLVTRTVHARTDARSLWRKWRNRLDEPIRDQGIAAESLTGHWPRIAVLCEALASEAPGVDEYLRTRPKPLPPLLPDAYPADKEEAIRQVNALEAELTTLIKKQHAQDHCDMKMAIENMLHFVQRWVRGAN